eukprot:COSAG06_NODE_53920_length_297_cov_0.974747_1_plen_20_part_01
MPSYTRCLDTDLDLKFLDLT